jgi:hypothetical protein
MGGGMEGGRGGRISGVFLTIFPPSLLPSLRISPTGLPSLGDEETIMPSAFSFGWYLHININQDKVGREGGREGQVKEAKNARKRTHLPLPPSLPPSLRTWLLPST